MLSSIVALGCGGGSGGSAPTPPPSNTPPPSSQQNPCETVSLEPLEPANIQPIVNKTAPEGPPAGRAGALETLWKHRAVQAQQAQDTNAALSPAPLAEDVGDVAIVQDEGDLILRPNMFDLKGTGLRFAPNGAGGYDVSHVSADFRATLGNALALGDDDSFGAAVPFNFTFYNRRQTQAFVNSDGNITFEEEDRASSARDVSRLLTGPPRVSLFLSDLDPSSGGRVFLQAAGDQFTVTWCGVRAFGSGNRATVQVTLLPDGSFEEKFADNTTIGDAVVGASPGRTGSFVPLDLSAENPGNGGPAALGERFATDLELDLVGVAKKFYQTHQDLYDQLVIWTDRKVTRGSFAFEITVANEIRGIGIDIYDTAREFGSGGRLRSMVLMDLLSKYPSDPSQKFLGEDSTLSVLGQESGHRWLAFMPFRDHNGATSNALLGRDQAHWSFFFDSDASVMEGNDIENLGGGAFRTVAAVERYSRLDQYAMGFLKESDVPPFFYVEAPTNVQPSASSVSAPQVGVTFNGTARTVLVQDIIAVLGPRQPAAGTGSRVHRQAFLFVVSAGRQAASADVTKVDRIRSEWEGFFSRGTSGRGRAETRLNPGS